MRSDENPTPTDTDNLTDYIDYYSTPLSTTALTMLLLDLAHRVHFQDTLTRSQAALCLRAIADRLES